MILKNENSTIEQLHSKLINKHAADELLEISNSSDVSDETFSQPNNLLAFQENFVSSDVYEKTNVSQSNFVIKNENIKISEQLHSVLIIKNDVSDKISEEFNSSVSELGILRQQTNILECERNYSTDDTGEKDIACDEKFNDANNSTIVKNESIEQLHTELIIKDDAEEGTSESEILEENNSSDDEMEIFGQQTHILECDEKFNDAHNSTIVKNESIEQLHTELIIKDDAEEGTSESEILEDSSDVGYETYLQQNDLLENRVGDHTRENTAEEYFPSKHKVIHIDERPYSCDVCDKSFKTKQVRAKHKRIHSREELCDFDKPYSYDICEKKIYSSD
ncbi:zinc finger protein 271-like [Chrysoperla carnea]|uniref:zinc finger protein 271-like n=1 Tax=Chrysoperla carnea TaxID=189513 RepID=UPI001D067AD5|nr:zinc finger protein 271-like [Chrysoperla carnea]